QLGVNVKSGSQHSQFEIHINEKTKPCGKLTWRSKEKALGSTSALSSW
ncbi:hypothetical protein D046_1948B, partial [Vibrio parahaemolyticus V-223/04]